MLAFGARQRQWIENVMNKAEARVAVLMGGCSKEREISLVTGRQCAAGLREAGFRSVTEIDVSRDLPADLARVRPDVCFNALHGPLGEDGSIQGMLNVLGIPYTHSGVRASAIAMHKQIAKMFAEAIGIRCPKGILVNKTDYFERVFDRPYVIKPIDEGSSVDTYIVTEPSKPPFGNGAWPYSKAALLEELVSGQELTATVLDDEPLTVTEIVPAVGFYSYNAKYQPGGSRHILPAEIPAAVHRKCLDWAQAIHRALDCRGISRSDFLYDRSQGDAGLFFLEINTQPGMTSISLAPEQAEYCGISFPGLVSRLIASAKTDC